MGNKIDRKDYDNIKEAHDSLLRLVADFIDTAKNHFRYAKEIGHPASTSRSVIENARTSDHHMSFNMPVVIDQVSDQYVCRYSYPDGGQEVGSGSSELLAFCAMLKNLRDSHMRSEPELKEAEEASESTTINVSSDFSEYRMTEEDQEEILKSVVAAAQIEYHWADINSGIQDAISLHCLIFADDENHTISSICLDNLHVHTIPLPKGVSGKVAGSQRRIIEPLLRDAVEFWQEVLDSIEIEKKVGNESFAAEEVDNIQQAGPEFWEEFHRIERIYQLPFLIHRPVHVSWYKVGFGIDPVTNNICQAVN